MQKELILCADDFAQSESISSAILQLAQDNRLNAISCLVNQPLWHEAHAELFALQNRTFIGLHLNLTFGQPLSALWQKHYGNQFGSLPQLIGRTYARQLRSEVIQAEIQAQIDQFILNMAFFPDFIDGHQHVQQLPIIREALLKIYLQEQAKAHGFFTAEPFDIQIEKDPRPCVLRHTYHGRQQRFSLKSFPKAQILGLLGGRTWEKLLRNAQAHTNTTFGGIYSFAKAKNYRIYFKTFLKDAEDGGLIMCHPGLNSDADNDPLQHSRHFEYAYLKSAEFLSDLNEHAVQLLAKTS